MGTCLLDKIPNLDPVNRSHFEQYIRVLELKQLSPQTVRSKVWRVYRFLKHVDFKDAKLLTRDDVEDYVISRRRFLSSVTVDGEILELRLFTRWLRGKEVEKDLFQNIHLKRRPPKLPTDQLLSRADIQLLISVCDRPRDRALIMLMWDTGARISEIMALNIGHIEFDRYGAVVIVNGKTGRRRLRLIASVPELQTWLHQHPMRSDGNAPLFVTYNRYSVGTKRLSMHTVQNMLKRLAQRANMTKPVYPHAIRHARLTDLVRNEGSKRGL